jgi:hypothetical protein
LLANGNHQTIRRFDEWQDLRTPRHSKTALSAFAVSAHATFIRVLRSFPFLFARPPLCSPVTSWDETTGSSEPLSSQTISWWMCTR